MEADGQIPNQERPSSPSRSKSLSIRPSTASQKQHRLSSPKTMKSRPSSSQGLLSMVKSKSQEREKSIERIISDESQRKSKIMLDSTTQQRPVSAAPKPTAHAHDRPMGAFSAGYYSKIRNTVEKSSIQIPSVPGMLMENERQTLKPVQVKKVEIAAPDKPIIVSNDYSYSRQNSSYDSYSSQDREKLANQIQTLLLSLTDPDLSMDDCKNNIRSLYDYAEFSSILEID
jgi:hypothetical protein